MSRLSFTVMPIYNETDCKKETKPENDHPRKPRGDSARYINP